MYHANMLVAVTQVARIFEGNPWVTGFKQHADHLAPKR